MYVKPKKRLGQHFLKDNNIANKIVNSLDDSKKIKVLEIGSGMGILTDFLLKKDNFDLHLIEIDSKLVDYLKKEYPEIKQKIIHDDFLKFDINKYFNEKISIIGNFPYNISSQIFFKTIENRDKIDNLVGMIQKEVAERIVSLPGNKTYGILSVLLQAFYNIEYLFTINENVFQPPPKVKSAVIRLIRNDTKKLDCNEKLFFKIIKMGFNQRRKMLRNSLKSILLNLNIDNELFLKRPEQLNVNEFVKLTNVIENIIKNNK
ncbi:MAG: 16S rRNA (adenine(1518)-N(6)/adenine(1519)-N(6))-dimethyltransferase RsmA [Bacteroidales bacterium]|nr:16S rRNA (adenine(1518)-N(6)/adenine(1519)-N(6))-dimethyltransferase RsmA [Bacteroidales bacterium]